MAVGKNLREVYDEKSQLGTDSTFSCGLCVCGDCCTMGLPHLQCFCRGILVRVHESGAARNRIIAGLEQEGRYYLAWFRELVKSIMEEENCR